MRSVAAAHRRAERDALRQQREYERQLKQHQKMEELERAAYEVQMYENYIEVLQSVHKDCGEVWDWEAIKSSSPPIEPTRSDNFEKEAQAKLDKYKPGLLDKLLRRVESKREKLAAAITTAKEDDEYVYQKALQEYHQRHSDWKASREFAERILSGEIEAYSEAIKQIDPLNEISGLGSSLGFGVRNSKQIETTLNVNSDEVVPREVKSLLKSGKLSLKEMPKSKFNELYQDYICSCILRVA